MPELATSGNAFDKRRFSRRGFLGAGIASGFALAACASKPTASGAAGMTAAIDAAEAARPHSGRTVTATLTPQPARIDLGGPIVSTLTYGNTIPGPLIRATVGDEIVVSVTNRGQHVLQRSIVNGFRNPPLQHLRGRHRLGKQFLPQRTQAGNRTGMPLLDANHHQGRGAQERIEREPKYCLGPSNRAQHHGVSQHRDCESD